METLICKSCGSEVSEDCAFCPKCGKPLNDAVALPPEPQKRKWLLPSVLAGGALLLIVTVIIVSSIVSKQTAADNVNKVLDALAGQDFSEASTLFNEKINQKNLDKLEIDLSMRLDVLKDEFRDEAIDYNNAKMEIDTIKGFQINNLTDKISGLDEYINNLNDSRVAFSIAESLLGVGDYSGAIEQYGLVSMDDPNFSKAKDGVNKAITEYKQTALTAAASFADGKDYNEAIKVLDMVLTVVGNDADLLQWRSVYEKQGISEKINTANALVAKEDFSGANSILKQLQTQYPDNTDIQKALADVEINHINLVVQQANALSDESKFNEAINLLSGVQKQYPPNQLIATSMSGIQTKEMNGVLEQAAEFAGNRKYEDAIEFLNNSKYSTRLEVKDKIEYYTSCLPVWLEKMETLSLLKSHGASSIWVWNTNDKQFDRDNIDNSHSHGLGFNLKGSFGYYGGSVWIKSEYFLNKEYSLFEGTYALHFDSRSTTKNYVLKIYVDDNLKYTSPKLTAGVLPVDISLDVTNATKIIFYLEVAAIGSYTSHDAKLSLVDAAFYRQ